MSKLDQLEKKFNEIYSSPEMVSKRDFINEITALSGQGLNETQIQEHYSNSVSLLDIQDVINGSFTGEFRNY